MGSIRAMDVNSVRQGHDFPAKCHNAASTQALLSTESGTENLSSTRVSKTPYLLSLLYSCQQWRSPLAMMIAGVFQGSNGLMILYYGAQGSTSPQTNETRLMIDVLSCTVRNKIKKVWVYSRWERFKMGKSPCRSNVTFIDMSFKKKIKDNKFLHQQSRPLRYNCHLKTEQTEKITVEHRCLGALEMRGTASCLLSCSDSSEMDW